MIKNEKAIHQHRKDEHLSLAIKYWREQRNKTAGLTFSDLRLIPNTLPEIALEDIKLSSNFLGMSFEFPFYIEAMTGGTPRADKHNAQLAQIAKSQGLAMAVGSQSIALKYPELAAGFKNVRALHPSGFLFANLGAGHSLENAKRAVEMIEANALEIHVNTAQELPMDEGDRAFRWLDNINEISEKLEVPVIVKEVGFGMSQQTFKQLSETAVSAINIGGNGGTNFAWIERKRSQNGFDIDDFGLSTVESLLEAQLSRPTKPLIATGGITSAQDIVKSLILGADLASSAGFLLSTLNESGVEAVEALLEQWKADLAKWMTLLGVVNIIDLKQVDTLLSPRALSFIEQRSGKIW
ncbi:type 2 isopentenyl-diphosphate Delta-isomerase [Lactococcus taiwanensis]|uniref:type 2 isopentenyl-diphosphate Delta-isomerase n=1 Tax=Lactococcus taiwanensis TaxID=1151742 RepID=UPI003D112B7D